MCNTIEDMRRKIVAGERLDSDDAEELYRRIEQHLTKCEKCDGKGRYTKRGKNGHILRYNMPCPRCFPLRDK